MKLYTTLIIFFCFLNEIISQNEAIISETTTKYGLLYKNNVPFSGVLYSDEKASNECSCTLESNYIKGKLNGSKKEWYNTGILKYEGFYKNGVLTNLHKFYNEFGKLIKTEEYSNGELIEENIIEKASQSQINYWNKQAESYYKVKDFQKAFTLYKKAALNGNDTAQNVVGVMYENGKGVNKSYKDAFYWYFKSAKQNNAKGQMNLAYLYFRGNGVEKDKLLAEEYLIKSANQGDLETQFVLGTLYTFDNGSGLYYDLQKAKKWFLITANSGHTKSQEELGAIFFQENDFSNAAFWYLKSAEKGNSRAQFVIGYLYKNGKGVKKSKKKAKYWWKKSCNLGYSDSCKEIKKMNAFGNAILKSVGESIHNYKPKKRY